jgi:uncharacterized protein YciI
LACWPEGRCYEPFVSAGDGRTVTLALLDRGRVTIRPLSPTGRTWPGAARPWARQAAASSGNPVEWLGRLLADGVLILAGLTLGPVNTGIGIFEAPDEETARAIIAEDPVASGGFARAEVRPYQLGFLRGRE